MFIMYLICIKDVRSRAPVSRKVRQAPPFREGGGNPEPYTVHPEACNPHPIPRTTPKPCNPSPAP